MSSEAKGTFFKQSGWMMFSTLASGFCMLSVHVFGTFMGQAEYSLFGALMGMMNVLTIPGLGLQTVFAQQTAAAVTDEDRSHVASAFRTFLWWTFVIWIIAAVSIGIFQQALITDLKISNPAALWVTVIIGLGQLWMPIVLGVLQGAQNFLWLGAANMSQGVGRFVAVGVIVVFFGGKATGGVIGAFIGVVVCVLIGFIHSRPVWQFPATSFKKKVWLDRVVPLTLGLGASQILFSVDIIVVRSLFGEAGTGFYTGAAMIGRGLVAFTVPLSLVMFPKIVHGMSHGKKSNVMMTTLLLAGGLAALAALACTVGAMWLQHIIDSPATASAPGFLVEKVRTNREGMRILATLLPWFVWCMLPLAFANVLLNSLLAQKAYRVVLYAVGIAIAYCFVLRGFGTSFVRVAEILGSFNLLFLGVLIFFTWRQNKATAAA